MDLKYKIHDLAKLFDRPSKELADLINSSTVSGKKYSTMTTVTDDDLEIVFELLTRKAEVPSFAELERRLRGRGDTVGADLERRLRAAREEYAQAPKYDYIVVNDRVEHCADEVMAILTADKCRAKYRLDLLKEDD